MSAKLMLCIMPGFVCLVFFVGAAHSKEPRLEKRMAGDSTIFSLSVNPKQKIQAGKIFQAKIHVDVRTPWHVYSSLMKPNPDGSGTLPMSITFSAQSAKYFEIVKITERGSIVSAKDTEFDMVTKAHYGPYDILIAVKVRPKSAASVPFSVILRYQSCSTTLCMPPRSFEVPMTFLGQKPVQLMISRRRSSQTIHS